MRSMGKRLVLDWVNHHNWFWLSQLSLVVLLVLAIPTVSGGSIVSDGALSETELSRFGARCPRTIQRKKPPSPKRTYPNSSKQWGSYELPAR